MAKFSHCKVWDNLEGEEWRCAPGSDDLLISNMGRLKNNHGILLQTQAKEGSYRSVYLKSEAGIKSERTHRLVLMAFDRQPRKGEVARHLNGVISDNRLSNLSWGTQSQNMRDKIEHGRFKVPNKKLTDDDVHFIRSLTNYRGLTPKLALRFSVSYGTIRDIRARKTYKLI